MRLDLYNWIAIIIVIIGGINWGLIGLFNANIVAAIFGVVLSRIIYIIVGIAAGYLCYQLYLARKATTV